MTDSSQSRLVMNEQPGCTNDAVAQFRRTILTYGGRSIRSLAATRFEPSIAIC
jgi:hypothetical protein